MHFWLTPDSIDQLIYVALNLLQFMEKLDCVHVCIFFCQGKLVKLFSRQFVAKQKCNEDWYHNKKLCYYPKLEQWLQVVGINEEAIKVHAYMY